METIINLTKGQKDTLNALEKGDYSKLRMANITRLLKKTINNEELSKKIIPRVVDYQRKVQNKNNNEVKKDLLKRLKDFPNKSIISEIIEQIPAGKQTDKDITPTESKTSSKPQFDTSQDLESLLDDLVKPKKKLGEDGAGRPPVPQEEKKRAIEPEGQTPEYAKPKVIGGDKGLPPKPKLMAMAKPTFKELMKPRNPYEKDPFKGSEGKSIHELPREQQKAISKAYDKTKRKEEREAEKKREDEDYRMRKERLKQGVGTGYDLYEAGNVKDLLFQDYRVKKAKHKKGDYSFGKYLKDTFKSDKPSKYDKETLSERVQRKLRGGERPKAYEYYEEVEPDTIDIEDILDREYVDPKTKAKREAELWGGYEFGDEDDEEFPLEIEYKDKEGNVISMPFFKDEKGQWKSVEDIADEPPRPRRASPSESKYDSDEYSELMARGQGGRYQDDDFDRDDEEKHDFPTDYYDIDDDDEKMFEQAFKEMEVKPSKKSSGSYPVEKYNTKPTKGDKKKGRLASIKQFMKRNGKSGVPSKADMKAYADYVEQATKSIDALKEDWKRIQDDIAANRQKAIASGDLGQPLTDKDDPFGLLRGLGYKYTSDYTDETASMLGTMPIRVAGNVAGLIPGIGGIAQWGLNTIADVFEGAANWGIHKMREREYEHGKLTLDDIRAYGRFDEEKAEFEKNNPGVAFAGVGMGDRKDMYYQPNWDINTYLPQRLDKYGYPNLNGGLQDDYLKPLERYTALLNSTDIDFRDSLTKDQTQFLTSLRSTIAKVKTGDLNFTHKQYRDLLKAMIGSFTPDQREAYLKDVNKQVSDDVEKVYRSGSDGNKGTVQGGAVPFGERFIQDVEDAIVADDYDSEDDEWDDEGDEGDEGTATPEDDPDKPDKPDKPEDEPEEPPEEPDMPGGAVKEHKWANDFGHEPKYRPRGQWGGTDELFQITESEKQKRNLIIESSTLNEGIDRTNPFFKRQQIEYDMRYRNTFPMPRGEPTYIPRVSDGFQKANRSIWISQRVPTFRPMEDSMRDAYDWGQYQDWQPKYEYDTARGAQMTNTNNFPSVADSLTQGENNIVMPMTSYQQQILNQRWTRR